MPTLGRGPMGPAGAVWREGSGAPSNGSGVNGDFYLDGATGNVYLRSSGTYTIQCNIKGATGTTGATGSTGSTGATGATGAAGAAGADGAVWREGSGAPSNGTGVNGDFYLDGSSGDVYRRVAGAYALQCNIKGLTGATGPSGVVAATAPITYNSGTQTVAIDSTAYLHPSNNLSDVATPATARTNLGLGTSATHPATDFLTPSGSGASLTGITESQVTNLVSDLALKAPLASPTLTGTPAAPTATVGTNTTQVATTAFVQGQGFVTASTAPVTSVASRTGAVTLSNTDISGLGTAATHAATEFAQALQTTTVKTSAYNAVAGDLVPVDTTSAGVTITLPTAPPDATRVAIKLVILGAGNAVTIATGGSDVINRAGGPTSFTLTLLSQAASLQYKASGAIWYIVSTDVPLAQTDLRYASSISLTTPNTIYSTPITFTNTAGAFAGTLTLNTQAPNTVFAGPTSGGSATPSFRTLVTSDLPAPSGDGSGLTNLNATALASGTVADARLSANVPLLNAATTNVFTGVLKSGIGLDGGLDTTVSRAYSQVTGTNTAQGGGSVNLWLPRMPNLSYDLVMDYQDELALQDKKGNSIAITSGASMTGSALNVLRDDATVVSWAVGSSPWPIAVEVDCTAVPIPANGTSSFTVGLTLRSSFAGSTATPTNIKVEFWDSLNSIYVSGYDGADHMPAGFSAWLSPMITVPAGTGGTFNVTKLRVTLSGTNPVGTGDTVRIQRVILYHATSVWDPWHLHVGGGSLYGNLTLSDVNVVLGTTTGTKIGTSTSQKLGFYNSTPIVQPSGSIVTALTNLGLVASPTFPAASLTGSVAIANGGTGATTAAAGFDALAPTTTLGDISYRGASTGTRLAGNTTSVKQYLSQTGTGSVSAAPAWATIAGTDIGSGTVADARLSANVPLLNAANAFSSTNSFAGNITITDVNVVLGTTTGTKIGTATAQKLSFYNSTPIVQPSGAALTALSNLGLVASPTLAESDVANLVSDLALKAPLASPTFTGAVTLSDINLVLGTTTGSKIGTSTSQKLGFYNSTPIVQPSGDVITALTNLGLVASPTISESDVTSLVSDLALKSPLASPTFTGSPAAPTPAASDNSTKLATTAYADRLNSQTHYMLTGSGLYYPTVQSSGTSTSATLANGTLRVMPCYIPRAITITRIGVEIVTGTTADAGTKIRLGIYNDNGSGYPGTLLLDAGQVAADAVAYVEATVSQALGPGLYWFGAVIQANVTIQPTVRVNSPVSYTLGGASTPVTGLASAQSYFWAAQTGALNTPFVTTPATTASSVRIMVKVT